MENLVTISLTNGQLLQVEFYGGDPTELIDNFLYSDGDGGISFETSDTVKYGDLPEGSFIVIPKIQIAHIVVTPT